MANGWPMVPSAMFLRARVALQSLYQRGRAPAVARDDQNRVIARDAPDRLRQLRAIDRDRERLRLPDAGSNDDELLHPFDAAEEVGRGAFERGERGFRVRRVRAWPLVRAVARALDEAELLDVARDRRLRGVEAARAETPAKLLLAVERFAVDELEYGGLAARFHQVGTSDYTSILVASLEILCINILSDAYSVAADPAGHGPRARPARARGARRSRRRHRLRRPGAVASRRASAPRDLDAC